MQPSKQPDGQPQQVQQRNSSASGARASQADNKQVVQKKPSQGKEQIEKPLKQAGPAVKGMTQFVCAGKYLSLLSSFTLLIFVTLTRSVLTNRHDFPCRGEVWIYQADRSWRLWCCLQCLRPPIQGQGRHQESSKGFRGLDWCEENCAWDQTFKILWPWEHHLPHWCGKTPEPDWIRGYLHYHGLDGDRYAPCYLLQTRFDRWPHSVLYVPIVERLSLHPLGQHYPQRFEAFKLASEQELRS